MNPALFLTTLASPEGVGGYTFVNAEAEALAERFTTPPTDARKLLIDNLVGSLKSAGVWSKLDAFYVMAAETEQAGQRNWVKDAHNLNPVNSPTFTTDRGYDFNGTTQYLNTQYTPSTQAVQYALNSASAFVWCTEDVQADTYAMAVNGTGGLMGIIPRRNVNQYLSALNSSTVTGTTTGTVGDSKGLTHVDRSSSVLTTTYKDGTSATTNTVVSAALPDFPIFLGARNVVGTPGSPDTRAQAAAGIGASLGSTAAAALHTALNTYLVAVGAVP